MIEVKITQQMIDAAKQKSDEMGTLKNSITSGEGNLAGFIGEVVANTVLKGKISNTYNYDILVGDLKYDVKTKRCTSRPKSFYECSVANFNTQQHCDRYVFVRIQLDRRLAWILGWEDRDEYYKRAKRLHKGEIDPSNNFTVKADCWNLPISKLKQFGE